MPTMPDKSVDMVLCDLPYGTTRCSWDTVIPLDKLWSEYKRVCKGAIVLTAAQPFTSFLVTSGIDLYRYSWVWEKSKATGFLNSKKRPLVAHEDVLVFSENTPVYYPQMSTGLPYDKGVRKAQTKDDVYNFFNQVEVKSSGERYPRSVIYFTTAEREGGYHKTQKPVALMEYLIKTYSNEGDTVLDNCMGSGTTGVACKSLGRNFIGIEKEEKYFNIAKDRIGAA